jgi:glycosyltransferase involved in cell wall biosynthesis
MKIGIDARAAAEERAGRGRVTRELLEALSRVDDEHEFVLYCRRPATELRLDRRFSWREVHAPEPVWHVQTARLASRCCDVFFSTNSYLTLWFTSIPAVQLVYDMIAFVPGAGGQRRASLIERATIRPALRRAGALICISRATERDLSSRFARASGKTTVISLAASPRFSRSCTDGELAEVRRRYRLERPFVLSTATLEPRKNLPRLIEAFAALPAQVRDAHLLVLAGPDGWEMEETLRSANLRPELVKLLGYVPEDDLAALYQACTVFCYPSLYEGFGLPLIEAMRSGAPVITSNVSSLPEVAGDGALYVNPLDVAEIGNALEELLSAPHRRDILSRRGRDLSARLGWEQSARAVLDRLVAVARPAVGAAVDVARPVTTAADATSAAGAASAALPEPSPGPQPVR